MPEASEFSHFTQEDGIQRIPIKACACGLGGLGPAVSAAGAIDVDGVLVGATKEDVTALATFLKNEVPVDDFMARPSADTADGS